MPISLKLLLIYQWIVAVICIGYGGGVTYALFYILSHEGPNGALLAIACAILVLTGYGAAMIFASVGITRRNPRAFLVGMICHLILEIPALSMFVTCAFFFFAVVFSESSAAGWAGMFLLFALMWLPFVLISGWAFFHLRLLGKSLAASIP